MATLIFSAVGTLIGGPLGGAVGALIGRQVDGAILGSGHREGPRLKELTATTSTYGTALPRQFGRMRVPGTIIWATDLVEHSEEQGGGKGQPSITTYSYTVSFAVALSSRPILEIGRIWADGKLLRGVGGDLKTAGTLRVHTGHGDQRPDPLIAAAEAADRCPAYRGLAYVVFEDLALSDFYNRIPSLTFEVIADHGDLDIAALVGDTIEQVDAGMMAAGVAGYSCEGPLAEALSTLDPFFPMGCDAGGDRLTISPVRLQDGPIVLPPPAITVADGEFGAATGHLRKRAPLPSNPPEVLRYYDIGRDYQPGMQRASGRPAPGQPRTVDLPAALSAGNARELAERAARTSYWRRETLGWRSALLDPAVGPGSLVVVPGEAGRWRVDEWEWRDEGVELSLSRVLPAGADVPPQGSIDPGRLIPPSDFLVSESVIAAFELPWDGLDAPDRPQIFAAVSAAGAGWSGAALYADHGDGDLIPLGPSGRGRALLGTTAGALAPASPLLFDRSSSVVVTLIDPAMALHDATARQLATGANMALVGGEILQFGRAVPLGSGQWRLKHLLRGRGGTEGAVATHSVGERFVLLDGSAVSLEPGKIGIAAQTTVLAVGRGDDEPVESAIALRGASLRPLSPVHASAVELADGALSLRWTRRARGAWHWRDGVDVPLVEQAEAYQVTFGPVEAPLAIWEVATPELVLPAPLVASLADQLPGGSLAVRQLGSHALSPPLDLATLG